MMQALCGCKTLVSNVNLPNIGQAPDLPIGAIVETNAVFRHNTVKPLCAGRMNNEIRNMVARHVGNHETILKAALTRDKELAFAAFINDPLVTCSLTDAKALFDEMLQNTKKDLPGWEL